MVAFTEILVVELPLSEDDIVGVRASSCQVANDGDDSLKRALEAKAEFLAK
jgi:hypothetical protein